MLVMQKLITICLFRCSSIPFFGKIISQQGVRPDPRNIHVLTDMPPLKTKEELWLFLDILNYLSNPTPMIAGVYDTVKADISKDRMFMEQNVPRSV